MPCGVCDFCLRTKRALLQERGAAPPAAETSLCEFNQHPHITPLSPLFSAPRSHEGRLRELLSDMLGPTHLRWSPHAAGDTAAAAGGSGTAAAAAGPLVVKGAGGWEPTMLGLSKRALLQVRAGGYASPSPTAAGEHEP